MKSDDPISSSTSDPKHSVAVFVHGLFSDKATWNPLIRHLSADPFIGKAYRLECFEYESPVIQLNPLRRIPSFVDLADKLRNWLKQSDSIRKCDRIVLIGHSQGGLVIQHFLSDVLSDGSIDELRKIRAIVLMATPNTGSELFLSVRRGLARWWCHPQEAQLRPFDDAVERVRRVVLERAVLAPVASQREFPVRFFVYAGETDNIVHARSAKWMFPGAAVIPGDHFSIHVPKDVSDQRYLAVKHALSWARRSFPNRGLLLETEALELSSTSDMEALNQLATGSFVPSQTMRLKDLQYWLENYQETWQLRLSVLVAKANKTIEAFLMFHESEELILIDYIASKQSRELFSMKRSGHAGILVDLMAEQLRARSTQLGGTPIVFEVEDPKVSPNTKEALARIEYFRKLGAKTIDGLRYLAPDMNTMAPDDETPHILMYVRPGETPSRLKSAHVKRIIELIYTVWYRNWFSNYPNATQHELYLRALYDRVASSIESDYDLR